MGLRKSEMGQSYIKILSYVSRGEKLGRILTGDDYGQPQSNRSFVQLEGIKPGGKTRIQGRDRVDPEMENRGLSYLKILEYIHHNEK